MQTPRVVVWFSCGAASAVAAKLAMDKWSSTHEVWVVYCDTSANEHPDNARFLLDVGAWIKNPVQIIRSSKFKMVEEVFAARRFMGNRRGAPCTVELKKIPRFRFQRGDDINIFGFTADEGNRIEKFKNGNPEMELRWPLKEDGISKRDCYRILTGAGIALPAMYLLGYKNNNCIGCVKATSPAYWQKVKADFPAIFKRRARQSRDIGARLTRIKGKRIFLDELPEGDYGRYKAEDISCGPECGTNGKL